MNDGGPAFSALPAQTITHENGRIHVQPSPGMSLRDYFAGQAMVALVRNAANELEECDLFISETAYRIADALLAERAKFYAQNKTT